MMAELLLHKHAPNYKGFVFPIDTLEFPESSLDHTNSADFNNHHLQWPRLIMAQCAIYQTLRDLEGRQERVPIDTHVAYHRRYEPCAPPTLCDALERIEYGLENNENLHIRQPGVGYVRQPLTEALVATLKYEYTELTRYAA